MEEEQRVEVWMKENIEVQFNDDTCSRLERASWWVCGRASYSISGGVKVTGV